MDFFQFLDQIEKTRKKGELDKAWRLANEAAVKLPTHFERTMMYYQMSLIAKREKNYSYALALMAPVVSMILKESGSRRFENLGKGHQNHILFLLKKVNKMGKTDVFLIYCKGKDARKMIISVQDWIKLV